MSVNSANNSKGIDVGSTGTEQQYYWSLFDYPIDLPSSCTNTNSYGINTSYAYQSSSNACYSLGSSYNVWLYDPYNPVKGLTINNTKGSSKSCPYDLPDGNGRKRTFRINFICAGYNNIKQQNGNNYVYTGDTQVEEIDDCVYILDILDILACPKQCISQINDELTLCSSNGICALDQSVGFVRCLCSDGYTGDYCQDLINGMFQQSNHSDIIIQKAQKTVYLQTQKQHQI